MHRTVNARDGPLTAGNVPADTDIAGKRSGPLGGTLNTFPSIRSGDGPSCRDHERAFVRGAAPERLFGAPAA